MGTSSTILGFINMNNYSWTKKIHMIKMMGIIVYIKRTINKLFDKPKNLFAFEI